MILQEKMLFFLEGKNLNKVKYVEENEVAIKKNIWVKTMLWASSSKEENYNHIESCNIHCINYLFYKMFVGKDAKLLGKYIQFMAHLKNIDGIIAPSKEKLNKLGLNDVSTTLRYPTTKTYTKEDHNRMVIDVVVKGAIE